MKIVRLHLCNETSSIGRYRGPLPEADRRWFAGSAFYASGVVGSIGNYNGINFVPYEPYRIRKRRLRDFYRKRTAIVMRNGSYIFFFDEGPPADVFVGSNNDGPIYME